MIAKDLAEMLLRFPDAEVEIFVKDEGFNGNYHTYKLTSSNNVRYRVGTTIIDLTLENK